MTETVMRPFHKQYAWAALEAYGEVAQLDQAVEELLELALAVRHYLRGRPDSRANVVEEMADVQLMLDQLREILLVSGEELDVWRTKKVVILMTKIDASK